MLVRFNIRQRFVVWLMGCCILGVLVYPPWWSPRPHRDWLFRAFSAGPVRSQRQIAGTVADLGKRLKKKYPGTYDNLPDAEVGRRVRQKFPGSYDDFVDVFGLLRDPMFRRLPVDEQLKTLRDLDANFANLPHVEQVKVLQDPGFLPLVEAQHQSRFAGVYFTRLATEIALILAIGSGLLWVLKSDREGRSQPC